MTDRYEKIRKGLAMRPTPGPWELKDGRTDTIENAQGYPVCIVHHHPYERYSHGVRAAYIAACDPDTIRALLAERDELAKDAARYRWLRARWGRVTDTYKGDSGHITWIDVEPDGEGWDTDPDSLDAAIDAAMQRTGGGDHD